MDYILYLYTVMDVFLMYFYRLPDNLLLGYFLGTLVLSFACIAVGKYSISFAFRLNREKIDHDNHEIEHYQNLSLEALKTGDKAAYKACNSIANEAYGKNFFSQIALSASSLWPVFFALGWMQYRFSGVTVKLPFSMFPDNYSFGYVTTFVVCYLIARICAAKMKEQLLKYRI
jgi:hypothetical protein